MSARSGSDIKTILKSSLSTSILNIDSSHIREPSQHERKEGWTEVFGSNSNKLGTKSITEYDSFFEQEQAHIVGIGSTIQLTQFRVAWYEQLILRIANLPHLVLNSSYIATESTGSLPYLMDLEQKQSCALVGRNQGSTCNAHSNSNHDTTSTTTTPSVSVSNDNFKINNDIVKYLKSTRGINLDSQLITQEQKDTSYFLKTILEKDLNFILESLRYCDSKVWEDVYKPQYIRASLDPDGEYTDDINTNITPTGTTTATSNSDDDSVPLVTKFLRYRATNGFFNIGTWFQTWADRSVHMKHLTLNHDHRDLFHPHDPRQVNVDEALSQAKVCYSILDSKLKYSATSSSTMGQSRPTTASSGATLSPSSSPIRSIQFWGDKDRNKLLFLIEGTTTPTLVDVMLFAHLADALCDVHLITILSQYTYLIQFFQSMYETYFGKKYIDDQVNKLSNPSNNNDSNSTPLSKDEIVLKLYWIHINNRINSKNQFNRIPILCDENNTHQQSFRKLLGRSTRSSQSLGSTGSVVVGSEYKDAIQIMQSVALHCNDLREVLYDVSLIRKQEDVVLRLLNKSRAIGAIWNKLRMGGDIFSDDDDVYDDKKKKKKDTSAASFGGGDGEAKREEDENQKRMMQMIREAKKNDELWLSSVFAVAVIGFFLATSNQQGE